MTGKIVILLLLLLFLNSEFEHSKIPEVANMLEQFKSNMNYSINCKHALILEVAIQSSRVNDLTVKIEL